MKYNENDIKYLLKQEFDSLPVPDSVSPEQVRRHLSPNPQQPRRKSNRIWIKIGAMAAAAAIVVTSGLAAFKGFSGEYSAVHSALRENSAGISLFSLLGAEPKSVDESTGPIAEPTTSINGRAYTETNIQVEGVDEADVVKTDGTLLYVLKNNGLFMFELASGDILSSLDLSGDYILHDMYLYENALLIAASPLEAEDDSGNKSQSAVLYVSASGGKLALQSETLQSGSYVTSRLTGGMLYLVTDYSVYRAPLLPGLYERYIPYTVSGGRREFLDNSDIVISENCPGNSFTMVSSYSAENGEVVSALSLLSNGCGVYCSADMLYLYCSYPLLGRTYTEITAIPLEKELSAVRSASVAGTINNQFSFTRRGEYLIVCTTYTASVEDLPLTDEQKKEFGAAWQLNANAVYTLDSSLTVVSSLKGLGINEKIESVRSVGNYLYFVTFEQTDPLFSVDISQPQNLKLVGELKLPGFSAYLHPYSESLLVGLGYSGEEDGTLTGLKLSLFDTSDSSAISEISSASVSSMSSFCEAIDNHKAFFADVDNALAGLPLLEHGDQGLVPCFKLYSVSGGEITELCRVEGGIISGYSRQGQNNLIRALRSGETLYVVLPSELVAISLSDCSQIYRSAY